MSPKRLPSSDAEEPRHRARPSRRTGFAIADALRIHCGPLEVFSGPGDGEALIEAVRCDPAYDEGAARKAVLDVFEVLGPEHPLTDRYRKQLAGARNGAASSRCGSR